MRGCSITSRHLQLPFAAAAGHGPAEQAQLDGIANDLAGDWAKLLGKPHMTDWAGRLTNMARRPVVQI
jgi:hypothetical protein